MRRMSDKRIVDYLLVLLERMIASDFSSVFEDEALVQAIKRLSGRRGAA